MTSTNYRQIFIEKKELHTRYGKFLKMVQFNHACSKITDFCIFLKNSLAFVGSNIHQENNPKKKKLIVINYLLQLHVVW